MTNSDHTDNQRALAVLESEDVELEGRLHDLTVQLVSTAMEGDPGPARDELVTWLRLELLPHLASEEGTLYTAAAGFGALRLLILDMLDEDSALLSLVDELTEMTDPVGQILAAAAVRGVFSVHLGKKRELLLPALDAAGVDLMAPRPESHGLLLLTTDPSGPDAQGCACGYSHPAPTTTSSPAAAAVIDTDGQTTLDVRALPHGSRHDVIFELLSGIGAGASLVIVNDHDPKPLRYQTEAMWPGQFTWSYRESGPELWRVAISRAG